MEMLEIIKEDGVMKKLEERNLKGLPSDLVSKLIYSGINVYFRFCNNKKVRQHAIGKGYIKVLKELDKGTLNPKEFTKIPGAKVLICIMFVTLYKVLKVSVLHKVKGHEYTFSRCANILGSAVIAAMEEWTKILSLKISSKVNKVHRSREEIECLGFDEEDEMNKETNELLSKLTGLE
jgi:hypothetical protein